MMVDVTKTERNGNLVQIVVHEPKTNTKVTIMKGDKIQIAVPNTVITSPFSTPRTITSEAFQTILNTFLHARDLIEEFKDLTDGK